MHARTFMHDDKMDVLVEATQGEHPEITVGGIDEHWAISLSPDEARRLGAVLLQAYDWIISSQAVAPSKPINI
jgi:prolyl-tRNA editing enzyme YbaK/EbsC (Cys-tRNA(Pro) deacylase)